MADFDRIETGAVSNTRVNEQFTTALDASVSLAESATMYVHLLTREEATKAIDSFEELANLALGALARCRELAEESKAEEQADAWVPLAQAAQMLDVSEDEVHLLYHLERLAGEQRAAGFWIERSSIRQYRRGALDDESDVFSDESLEMLRPTNLLNLNSSGASAVEESGDDFDEALQNLFDSPEFRKVAWKEAPTRQTLGLKLPPPLPGAKASDD